MATFKRNKLISKINYIKYYKNANLYLKINSYILYINSTEISFNKALYYKTNINNIIFNKPYSPELGIKYLNKELEF
jgi:hypothetical protein